MRGGMKTRTVLRILCLMVVMANLAGAAAAGEWTYWRGPNGNGVSDETGLIDHWSPDGENLLWKDESFIGRSTPVIVDGRACVIGRTDGEKIDRQELVICYDADSGKRLWEDRFNIYNTTVPYNRVGWASLAADGETGNVYAHGVAGQLIAYAPDGTRLWEHFLTESFGRFSGYGGRTQTPLVEGDQVIVSYVCSLWGPLAPLRHRYFSFDKNSGELLWISTPGGRPYDFNTQSAPVPVTLDGQRLLVTGNADGWIYGLRAYTGEKVWSFNLSKRGINSTVLVNDGVVYASHSEENIDTPVMGRLVAFKAAGGSGDITSGSELWRIEELASGFPSPTLQDGVLYVVDNSANMSAIEAETGKVLWDHSIGTVGKGSPVWADGKLYVTETNGHFHILKPGKEGVEVLDTEELSVKDGRYAEIYGSAAIAGGRIFFTTEGGIYCLGKSGTPFTGSGKDSGEQARGEGDAAWLQVVPAEVSLQPGESAKFTLRSYDAMGRRLGEQDGEWSLAGLTGKIAGGEFVPATDAGFQAGMIKVTAGKLSAEARVRVIPPLPWSEDFEGIELGSRPSNWVISGVYAVAEKDGGKALLKAPRERGLNRTSTYMGPSLSNYTIEADIFAVPDGRRRPDAGLIAGGYTLDLMGAHQKLQVRSWAAELRMAKDMKFEWEMEKWYRLKLRVDVDENKALIRGKVWPRDQEEPEAWTITVEDPHPIAGGSPGLVAYSPSPLYYDNLKVTENSK